MRMVKIIGISVGALVVLFILALVAASMLINPNDYKGRLIQAVRQSTGRELALPGDIKLSVFPWIALQLGPASLGNPPGFGSQPFVSLRQASLRVKVLPLLRGRLQIGRVVIDGLDLQLQRDAQGKGNWEGLGGGNSSTGSTQAQQPSAGSSTLSELTGVTIRDSRLSYQDMVADHVNLTIGRFANGATVPVTLKLDLTTSRGATPIALLTSLELVPDMTAQRYRITGLMLKGSLRPKQGLPAAPWALAVPQLSVDLHAQTLSVPQYSLQLASARLSGSAQGNRIVDAPSVAGSFRLEPVSPRELMHQLGMSAPQTRDTAVLSRVTASGQLAYGGNALRLTNLDTQLDDSRLQGTLAITNLTSRAVSFDLAVDRIDLDRYRSPEQPSSPSARATSPPSKLPTDTLKTLQMDGALTIGALKVAGVNGSQLDIKLAAHGGLMQIVPISAQLYGGRLSGDITLDARRSPAALKLDQNLTNVDVAQLLKDLDNTQRLSGRGNITANLTALGDNSDALLRSLSGHVTVKLADGAVQGIDLPFEVARATALIQRQSPPSGSGSGHTSFQTFQASADLSNGVATTRDLNVVSQNVRLTGQGTFNVVSEAVDYQLQVALAGNAGVLGQIPLDVTGSLSALKVRPDLQRLARTQLRQQLNQHKAQLQQKAAKALKGLFKGLARPK